MFRSEAGNISVFVSACFTARARCSSSCNESTLCWACRNVFCRVEVYWPSWQLAVLMKRAQVFRMERVQDVDSAFTVPLQCLYSSVCIMESSYRARCKHTVFGKRLSSPSCTRMSVFPLPATTLRLGEWGQDLQAAAPSCVLLVQIQQIPSSLARQDGGDETIQKEGGSSRG